MKAKRFLTRFIAVAAPFLVAASLTTATAVADPTIDPHVFDSGNKVAIAQTYGQVIVQTYRDAGQAVPTFRYAVDGDAARLKAAYPRDFVINIDDVYRYRQYAVFAPAFILSVKLRAHQEAILGRNSLPMNVAELPTYQAFVAGAVSRRMAEMTGLNIVPGDKDDRVIKKLLGELARTYKAPNGQSADDLMERSYENGFNTVRSGAT